jgi:lysophospholipase L1-like esterase
MYRKKLLLSIGVILILVTLGIVSFGVAVRVNELNSPKTVKVACIGDSITERGYPFMLRAMLGSEFTVANFGVSGSTVSRDSILPYIDQKAFQDAKDFDPDIIIIMLGTNDANPEITVDGDEGFEEDFKHIIYAFSELVGDEQIYVMKSPPILSTNSAYNNTYLVEKIIPQIDHVATELNLPIIDIYDTLGENPDYYSDGVHPNKEGSTIIASTVYDFVFSEFDDISQ